jgi:hypothetical protein
MWPAIVDALSKVTQPIPLAAVTVGLLALLVYYRRKFPQWFLPTVIVLVLAADATIIWLTPAPLRTYHVRLTVLDPQGQPVNNAHVVTTAGSEPLKVEGGYQIDISADKKPQDGKVQFIATEPEAFLKGEATIVLGTDINPQVTIKLASETENVKIGGIVEDARRNGLVGAYVSIGGKEGVTTGAGGGFSIAANAPVGKEVLLHAEKKGYKSQDQWVQAGSDNTVITLTR